MKINKVISLCVCCALLNKVNFIVQKFGNIACITVKLTTWKFPLVALMLNGVIIPQLIIFLLVLTRKRPENVNLISNCHHMPD